MGHLAGLLKHSAPHQPSLSAGTPSFEVKVLQTPGNAWETLCLSRERCYVHQIPNMLCKCLREKTDVGQTQHKQGSRATRLTEGATQRLLGHLGPL